MKMIRLTMMDVRNKKTDASYIYVKIETIELIEQYDGYSIVHLNNEFAPRAVEEKAETIFNMIKEAESGATPVKPSTPDVIEVSTVIKPNYDGSNVPSGLYRFFWSDTPKGVCSVGCVFRDSKGHAYFTVTNWSSGCSAQWYSVDRVELITNETIENEKLGLV